MDHVERTAAPDAADPALLERLKFFSEINHASLTAMSDFDFAKPHGKRHEAEEAEGDEAPPIQPASEWNLCHLTVEFQIVTLLPRCVPLFPARAARLP
jgi:hypothetical protein